MQALGYKVKRVVYVLASRFAGRIKAGPLQGCRWTLFSGIRFIRGDFEPTKTEAILQNLHPGDVFWDIGANVGHFSVLASRTVGPAGSVISIEPSPVNLAFLRRNLKLNRCGNVSVHAVAAAAESASLRLDTQSGRGTHHIDPTGDTVVRAESIDGLIGAGAPPPSFVKIDVEGFEESVLAGMTECLRKHQPKLMVAVHSESLERSTISMLSEFGYRVQTRIAESKGDVELLFFHDSDGEVERLA